MYGCCRLANASASGSLMASTAWKCGCFANLMQMRVLASCSASAIRMVFMAWQGCQALMVSAQGDWVLAVLGVPERVGVPEGPRAPPRAAGARGSGVLKPRRFKWWGPRKVGPQAGETFCL